MKKIRLEDDFYAYKNGKWLEEAVIPADKPLTGSFVEILINNEKTLMADLDLFVKEGVDHKIYKNALFDDFIKLYKQALDVKTRELEGVAFITKWVKRIEAVKNYHDLENLTIEFLQLGLQTILPIGISTDMKNSKIKTLYLGMPNIILPDKTYYDQTAPSYQSGLGLLAKYQETILKLLNEVGVNQASHVLEEALSFDQLLVPLSKTSEEKSDYIKSYNPYKLEDLANATKLIDIKGIINQVLKKDAQEVIVTNPKFVEGLNALLEGNLELIKSWLITKLVYSLSAGGYGTDDLRLKASEYGLLLTGQKEPLSFEKFTYQSLSNEFGDVVGLYFGTRYFGKKAKQQVEEMVLEFIEIYKKRLEKIDWLSKETIEKAIIKLSKIEAMIGYPDKVNPVFEKFAFDENKSFNNHMFDFAKVQVAYDFEQYQKEVDTSLWYFGAHVVNAYYSPTTNQIVFPAGILQPPFYSYEQTRGANYGGIGAVIAHEITHAFDTNGAKIDEFGNINNWWKEADFKAFNDKAEAMVDLFDGLDIPGTTAKCNGRLTVTENIADAAGISCAYEAGLLHQDFKPEDFFGGWADIWRFKANPAYMELLANVDVHSPGYLRGLVQLKNFAPFANFYNIQKTDGMYIDPKKMVSVW